jgi:hypothetical protein
MSAAVIELPRKLRFIHFGASKPSATAVPSRPTAGESSGLRPLRPEGYAEHRPPVVIRFLGQPDAAGRAPADRHGLVPVR